MYGDTSNTVLLQNNRNMPRRIKNKTKSPPYYRGRRLEGTLSIAPHSTATEEKAPAKEHRKAGSIWGSKLCLYGRYITILQRGILKQFIAHL